MLLILHRSVRRVFTGSLIVGSIGRGVIITGGGDTLEGRSLIVDVIVIHELAGLMADKQLGRGCDDQVRIFGHRDTIANHVLTHAPTAFKFRMG